MPACSRRVAWNGAVRGRCSGWSGWRAARCARVIAARGALPLGDVVNLARPVAAAIDYAQRIKLTRLELSAHQLLVHCEGLDAAAARGMLLSESAVRWEKRW